MPTCRRIWIAQLIIRESNLRKIELKYGLNIEVLRQYLICNPLLEGIELVDEIHGPRVLIVIQYTKKITVRIYLELIDENFSIWSIRTAIPSINKFRSGR